MNNAFDRSTEPQGRYGAVFERDDETAYFYLLDLWRPNNLRIIEALKVDFKDVSLPDVSPTVKWASGLRIVGLLVDRQPIAVFDLEAPSPHGRRAKITDMVYFTSDVDPLSR